MKAIHINYCFLYCCLFLLTTFTGCDSELNINPTDQYSQATFWQTREHADAGLTGCYKVLHDGYGGSASWHFETDMITPNGMAYNAANGTNTIARGIHTPITGLITSRWGAAYRGIGRTNTFLDKIDNVTMDDALKARMIGEAKFLRAFYYFILVDVYGGVPLILETPDAGKHAGLPRNSKDEVVTQILRDLEDAAPALPQTYGAADLGRVTRGAALALAARVALYNDQWSLAAQKAKEVMESGAYSLFPQYRELFLLENENNREVIFDVQFLAPRFTNDYDQVIYNLNRPAPLKGLVDAYLMTDGKPIAESALYDPERPYENRDPRLLQTIVCIGYPFNGRNTTAANVVTTGFGLKKYTYHTDNVFTPVMPANGSEINPIIIRYAEVLLTYAEARNEAGGPDESVYSAINQLRKRASVNMPDVTPGLTKEAMREVIRRERRIELAFEGTYYSDIRRWKTAEVVNNKPAVNHEGKVIETRAFNKDRDYLWPVPHVQIQENPNLEQNPNWN